MRRYLISYDISDDSVRGKVYRLLKKKARHIQKSVFFLEDTEQSALSLERFLLKIMDKKDSLLMLPCCESCYNRARISGPAPADIMIF